MLAEPSPRDPAVHAAPASATAVAPVERLEARGRARLRQIHRIALERLGRAWPGYHIGPPWPGVIPHLRNHTAWGPLLGFGKAFFEHAILEQRSAAGFFRAAGITEFALARGGVCSLYLGLGPALYIASAEARTALVREGHLVFSDRFDAATRASHVLISRPTSDEGYKRDRRYLERTLASVLFRDKNLGRAVASARRTLARADGRPMDLVDLLLELLFDCESGLVGLLDLHQVGLRELIPPGGAAWAEFRHTLALNDYFAEGRYHDKASRARIVRTFIRLGEQLLLENFESIRDAGEGNAIKAWFEKHAGAFPATREALHAFLADGAREDGFTRAERFALDLGFTFITGLFVNTVNALAWTVCEIERHPHVKQAIRDEVARLGPDDLAHKPTALRGLRTVQDAIVESLRTNPPVTIAGGQVVRPYEVVLRGERVHLPRGTTLLVDTAACNADPALVPHPGRYDLENVAALRARDPQGGIAALVHGHDGFASFAGGGREDPDRPGAREATRRCPGASFSVVLQSVLLAVLYREHDVTLSAPTRPDARGFTSHPLPIATITVTRRTT